MSSPPQPSLKHFPLRDYVEQGTVVVVVVAVAVVAVVVVVAVVAAVVVVFDVDSSYLQDSSSTSSH